MTYNVHFVCEFRLQFCVLSPRQVLADIHRFCCPLLRLGCWTRTNICRCDIYVDIDMLLLSYIIIANTLPTILLHCHFTFPSQFPRRRNNQSAFPPPRHLFFSDIFCDLNSDNKRIALQCHHMCSDNFFPFISNKLISRRSITAPWIQLFLSLVCVIKLLFDLIKEMQNCIRKTVYVIKLVFGLTKKCKIILYNLFVSLYLRLWMCSRWQHTRWYQHSFKHNSNNNIISIIIIKYPFPLFRRWQAVIIMSYLYIWNKKRGLSGSFHTAHKTCL